MKKGVEDALDFARIIWKAKIWVLIPLIAGIVIAQVVVNRITPIYSASTAVMVEAQKVPAAYVKSTITSRMQDRLKTLEQQIKKRETMEKLIVEADLFKELKDEVPMSELVVLARTSLAVRVERNRLVRVFFESIDPQEAADGANRIAELFIDENLSLRANQAENTTAFLETELERTKTLLEEQEARVSQYHLRNAGSLPTQREANFAAIAQLERQLDINRAKIEDAQLRQFLVEREDDSTGPVVTGAAAVEPTRLEQLELELQTLKAQYTSKHPDVVRLESEIASLRSRQAQTVIREPDPVVEELPIVGEEVTDTAELDNELTRLEKERLGLMEEIAKYQRRLEATPRVEQELISLTRDYDNLAASYQSLLAKQIEARLAEELERSQQSEQFKILDAAVPPSSPSYPNRLLFSAMGLVLGGGAGIGLGFLKSQLDDTYADVQSLARSFPGLTTVIGIPRLEVGLDQPNEADEVEGQISA